MKKYIPFSLSIIALIATLALVVSHFEYDGLRTIVFIAVALVIGYRLGSWTCHLHKRQNGFWVTIIVFVVLNVLHSMIDGASIGELSSFTSGLAVLSHELARQPALYIVLWGMLAPFVIYRPARLLLVPVIVTGTWLVGAYIGYGMFDYIGHAEWLEPIADMAVFLFLGDIIHHIREEYGKLRNKKTCCHN
jgi:hypothetical protein